MKKYLLTISSFLSIVAGTSHAFALSFKCVGHSPKTVEAPEEMWSPEIEINATFEWSSRASDRLKDVDFRFGGVASFHSPQMFEDSKNWDNLINPERYNIFTLMSSAGRGSNISFAVPKSLGNLFKFRSYILTDRFEGPNKVTLHCKRT